MRLGLVDEDEEVQVVTTRTDWEDRASKNALSMADEMLDIVRALDPGLELKFNKFYIGLAKGGQPNNFVIFRPKKDWLCIEVRLERSEETQAELDASGLDVMDYDSRWDRYRIRLTKGDIPKHRDFLTALMAKAFEGSA